MKVGIEVACSGCGKAKAPHGRSISTETYEYYCHCEHYNDEPKPGCLWPGETEEEFGFNVCIHATREEL